MFEILPHLNPSMRPNYDEMSVADVKEDLLQRGHCSALIKVADDLSELWAGHSSWFIYSNMLRVYKTYDFPLQNPALSDHETLSQLTGPVLPRLHLENLDRPANLAHKTGDHVKTVKPFPFLPLKGF